MNPELEKDSLQAFEKLSHNQNYYNNVFKRTEKVVSVIFYIISHTVENKKTDVHTSQLSKTALETHQTALQSLSIYEHEAVSGLEPITMSLVALDSSVTIAAAGGVISSELKQLLTTEIDSILRTIQNHFTKSESSFQSVDVSTPTRPKVSTKTARPKRTASIPTNDISSGGASAYRSLEERAERIKTVLEATGEASIKDISQVITDCSEKTIQRELNSLIEKGEIKRSGERRWSRYSLS